MNAVADSSFYILFLNEINDIDSLRHILDKYNMFIGKYVKNELKQNLKKNPFLLNLVHDISLDVDIGTMLKIFYDFLINEYPGEIKDINDGEYEVMGISYLLKQTNQLNYVIIDDKHAYNFVEKNLYTIKKNLIRTIRFICNGNTKDCLLDRQFILDIFSKVENAIKNDRNPLYLTQDIWDDKILPIIEKL